MPDDDTAHVSPSAVLDVWFPDDGHDASLEAHRRFWQERMRGGMDATICRDFEALTRAAARGLLDHWAATPRGRLALVIALDQFPRSLWRDTPAAYGQDLKAARLVLEGFANGHYEALPHVWEKAFCLIAVAHCEGPDHPERMRHLLGRSARLVAEAPARLALAYRLSEDQNRLAAEVIQAFGRYPHRNAVLGRLSTPAEEAYLVKGNFPHLRAVPLDAPGLEAMLARRESVVGPGAGRTI